MHNRLTQAIAVFAAPLVTLGATALVAEHVHGTDKSASDATGAALAGLAVFALTQGVGELPKRSAWWRRRYGTRAVFEVWWLQIHGRQDRAASFSFLCSPATDPCGVDGNAFDAAGVHLAH